MMALGLERRSSLEDCSKNACSVSPSRLAATSAGEGRVAVGSGVGGAGVGDGVCVGAMGVSAGVVGSGMLVGGTDVAVIVIVDEGGAAVSAGGMSVAVGGMGVAVGGTDTSLCLAFPQPATRVRTIKTVVMTLYKVDMFPFLLSLDAVEPIFICESLGVRVVKGWTPQLVGGAAQRTRTSSGLRYAAHAKSQRALFVYGWQDVAGDDLTCRIARDIVAACKDNYHIQTGEYHNVLPSPA